jgi:F-box and WD-40 domain protein MET30
MNPSQSNASGDETKFLFSASDDGTIKLWDLLQRTCIRTMTGHTGQVQSMRLVIVDRETDVAEEETPVTGYVTPLGSGAICSIPFLPNFHTASVGIPSSSAPADTVAGANNRRISASPPAPGFDPTAYRSNPDAPIEDRALVHESEPDNGLHISHMHVPEDKQVLLVSAGLDNLIKVWDVKTGKEQRTLFGHIEGVLTVDVDPLRLASGSHGE